MATAKETIQRKAPVELFTDIHKINVHMTNKLKGGTDEFIARCETRIQTNKWKQKLGASE